MGQSYQPFMIYSLNQNYYVRPLQKTDLEGQYLSWFEDQEVCEFNSHGKFPYDKSSYEKYIDQLNNQKNITWAICSKENIHIGNISLQNIHVINRNAELAILLGDKLHWGNRVGYLAASRLLDHGFKKLNLFRVYCGCASNNVAMIHLAKKLGMTQEGVRRNQLFLENNWQDVIEFGLLKSEYEQDNNLLT